MAVFLPRRWNKQPEGAVDLDGEYADYFATKVGHVYMPWLRKFNPGIIEGLSGATTATYPDFYDTQWGKGLGKPRIGGTVVYGLQVGTTQAPATSTFNVVFMACVKIDTIGGTASSQWQSGENATATRHTANINFDAGTASWGARSSTFGGIGSATFTLPSGIEYAAVAFVHDYTANTTAAFCNGVELTNTAYTNTGGGWFGGWANIWGMMPTFNVVYPCVLGWRTTRRMSLAQVRDLTVNPWQIFKPHTARIYSFPSAGGSLNVAATTDALTLAEYAATIGKSINVSATTDALTLAEYAATVSLSRDVSATTDALTLAEYAATISKSLNISATTDALTLAEYSATVSLVSGLNVNATTDALTLAEHAATIGLSLNVQATTDALTLTEYPANLGSVTNVQATTDTLTLVEYPASIAKSLTILTQTDTLLLREYKASVNLPIPSITQRGGISKWSESEYKLNIRLKKQALAQARLEDDEEALAILLATLIRK